MISFIFVAAEEQAVQDISIDLGLCVLGFTAGTVAACVAILVAFPEGSYSFCVEAIAMMEEGLMAHVFCESIGAC